jgi:YbbR domain-containing protein
LSAKTIRDKILSIAVSLLLSFFLWLALAGQDTSGLDLIVPLELANMPADLAIRSEVPAAVTFQVLANTAQGRFLADRKLNFQVDVASAREGHNVFPVDAEALDLPRGVSVRKTSPAVIEFETVKVADKAVAVKPTLTGELNPAYRIRSLMIEPDRVTVKGPPEILAAITELGTSPIALDGLTRDGALTVAVDLPEAQSPDLELSPREVRAVISLEERRLEDSFTGLPIGIDLKSGGRTSDVLLSPERADISVSWSAVRAGPVRAEEVQARVFVDAEKLKAEGRLTLPVVAVAPAGVTITAISPVNVTVTRRAVPVPVQPAHPAEVSAP